MRSNRRSLFIAAALLAGTALLTACSSDPEPTNAEAAPAASSAPATNTTVTNPSAPGSSSTSSGTKSGTTSEASKSSTGGSSTSSTSTGGSGTTPTSKTSQKSSGTSGGGSGSASDDDGTVIEGINAGEGVNGTWAGELKYLAPGKYTVSDQEFLVSDETEVWGAGDICGDAAGQSATECNQDELRVSADSDIAVEVIVENGMATRIVEDHR